MSDSNLGPLRTIVVATDFSFAAEDAIEHAARLATASGAALHVVHVAVPGEEDQETESLPSWDTDFVSHLQQREARMRYLVFGVPRATCEVRHGLAADVLLEEATNRGADLIVLGANGCAHRGRRPLGRTARQVIAHAPCAVLVVHAGDRIGDGRPRRVLVTTDFSAGARAATECAMEMLHLGDAVTLVLVHARASGAEPGEALGGTSLVGRRDDSAALLEREAAALRVAGAEPRTELLDGSPAESVVARARTFDADLIVAGTAGLTGIAHLIFGSTAEHIVETAPCPVFVVPDSAVRHLAH
jgi:nucleotide-binding universal stress UspA family protein